MRYISINEIEKGLLLASNLYNEKQEVVFKDGWKLRNRDIKEIKKAGYRGVYILDPCTDEIVPEALLPEDMYIDVIAKASTYIKRAQENDSMNMEKELQQIIHPVISYLLSRTDSMIDRMDLRPAEGYEIWHIASVMIYSVAIGIKMKFSEKELFELATEALLKNIGEKNGIAEKLEKTKVSSSEKEEYAPLPMYERFDEGYSIGSKKGKTSKTESIISISSEFDALLCKKSFRQAMFPVHAIEIIQQKSDRKYSPDIVSALEAMVALYPTGIVVELKSGEICIVSKNTSTDVKRPRLQLYDGKKPIREFIDLQVEGKNIKTKIIKILETRN